MRTKFWLCRLAASVAVSFGLIGMAAAGGHGHARGSDVQVNGYFKADGTFVAPHMRSAPDGDSSNNWSTQGNVNPYTGKEGTRATPPLDYGAQPGVPPAIWPVPSPGYATGAEPTKIELPPSPPAATPPIDPTENARSPAGSSLWPPQNSAATARRILDAQDRTQAYMDRMHQQDADRAAYWKSKGYDFNSSYMSAFAMDQKVKDINRAAYWKQRGHEFNPEYMSAFAMDQKVKDIERGNFWKSQGYSFDPTYMSAFSMDQKVHDIERAKYWKSQGFDFDPQHMSAFSMDLEAQRRLRQH